VRAGDFIYFSGGGDLFEDNPASVEQALRNYFQRQQEQFAEFGISYKNIIKVTCWLSKDYKYFDVWNKVYREFFSEPFPARSTVPWELEEGKKLGFEIEMVAYVGK
jgi:2-iminobutanoate/2-iminopropanoate deaminase